VNTLPANTCGDGVYPYEPMAATRGEYFEQKETMKTQTKRRDAEVAKARRAIAAIKPEPLSDSALSWKFARCVSALRDLTDAMTEVSRAMVANEKLTGWRCGRKPNRIE